MSENNENNEKKSWFRQNSGGMGFHPQTWQGWALLIGIVVVIVCVVVVLKVTLR